MAKQKATNEQIVDAWMQTGNTRAVAGKLGISNTTVWQRLRACGWSIVRTDNCKYGHPFDGHDGRGRTCSICLASLQLRRNQRLREWRLRNPIKFKMRTAHWYWSDPKKRTAATRRRQQRPNFRTERRQCDRRRRLAKKVDARALQFLEGIK